VDKDEGASMCAVMTAGRPQGQDATRREFIVGAAALSAAMWAGCGEEQSAGEEPATRSVADAFGRTRIPSQPKRVIADAVSTYAQLVSLGITPIAVALPTGISPEYISEDADRMTNVVGEDGWTIDVERALTLKPDLILAVGADYNREHCERYDKVVATYCFEEVYSTGTDKDIKDTLAGIAMALGREDEAAAAIAAYDRRVAALRKRVQASPVAGGLVGIVRFDAGGFIGIRTGDAANAVVASLGFEQPEWPKATVDGYVELSLERLDVLDRADILLVTTDDDVVREKVEAFKSPLWEQLEVVVRSGAVHFVGAWNGGDMPQLNRMLDDLEKALL
jgi:iron complex transport system substrate-binding protein